MSSYVCKESFCINVCDGDGFSTEEVEIIGCCAICKYSEGIWDEEKVGCILHGGLHKNEDVCVQFKEVGEE